MNISFIVTDGGSLGNPGPLYIMSRCYIPKFDFVSDRTILYLGRIGTNNEAEYLAVINAVLSMQHCYLAGEDLNNFSLYIITDSLLLVKQVLGRKGGGYDTKAPHLKVLNKQLKELLGNFAGSKIEWRRREIVNALLEGDIELKEFAQDLVEEK